MKRLITIFFAVVMAFTSVPLVPQIAYAQNYSADIDCSDQSSAGLEKIRDFYRRNDITGYDLCAYESAGICPPGASALSTVPAGGSNAEIAFKFLLGKGLTAKQAAGIVGNLMQESGGGTFNIDPTIQNSIGAFGIAQWLGARKSGLYSFASKVGKPPADLGVQLDYMWIELTGLYKTTTLDPIKASTDLATPTKIFLEKYEVPCLPGSSACAAELKTRLGYATKALEAFAGLSPGEVGSTEVTDPSCNTGGSLTGSVDANGYAFPVVLGKALISNGYKWPCKTSVAYCHHDGTPAFDLSKKPDNNTTGTPIVAVYAGTIIKIGMDYMGTGCQSIQYKADDGHNYWYGHIRTDTKTPKLLQPIPAGTYLGRVGESKCTGNGSYPHLHIDRGLKGLTAGISSNRDPAFIPIMNTLYENLPEGQ